MTTTKWRKRAVWLALNTGWVWVTWAGVVEHVGWAANLAKFYLWFALVLSFLILLVRKEPEIAAVLAKGPSVPLWINLTLDLAVAGLLASKGWFGYATICALTGFFGVGAYPSKPTPQEVTA